MWPHGYLKQSEFCVAMIACKHCSIFNFYYISKHWRTYRIPKVILLAQCIRRFHVRMLKLRSTLHPCVKSVFHRSIRYVMDSMVQTAYLIMTSSNGNIFRVTGHLCGEFTGPRWIPRTKASDAELRYLQKRYRSSNSFGFQNATLKLVPSLKMPSLSFAWCCM